MDSMESSSKTTITTETEPAVEEEVKSQHLKNAEGSLGELDWNCNQEEEAEAVDCGQDQDVADQQLAESSITTTLDDSAVSTGGSLDMEDQEAKTLDLASRSNVMNNEMVMIKISKKLPAGNLLVLRQTCRLWNRYFIPQLKKHGEVILKKGPTCSNLGDFMNVIRSSSGNPFTKYYFSGDAALHNDGHRLLDFTSTFGKTITTLAVKWEQADTSISELRKIIFELTPELTALQLEPCSSSAEAEEQVSGHLKMLPKLKTIAVLRDDYDRVVYPALSPFLSDVIRCAEELEWLDVMDFSSNSGFLGPVFASILSSPVPPFRKLKTLRAALLTKADFDGLIQLAERDEEPLRLDKFTTIILCKSGYGGEELLLETFRLLYTFLTTQSSTLNELTIGLWCKDNDKLNRKITPHCIPRMERLTKLSQLICGLGSNGIQIKDMVPGRFMDMFPDLKEFRYSFHHGDIPLPRAVDKLLHSGVAGLKVDASANNYMDFVNLAPIFTSLTRLELTWESEDGKTNKTHICGEEFAKMWTTWPALTKLHLNWEVKNLDFDLDAFVSGVPRAGLERLRQKLGSLASQSPEVDLNLTLASLRAMAKDYKIWPGISDLKQLEDLKITIDGRMYPRLTDSGGYFGLALASETLQRVVVHGDGKNLISDPCLALIRKTFGLPTFISL